MAFRGSEDEEERRSRTKNEEFRNDDETGNYDGLGFWIPKEVRDEEEPKSGCEKFRNDDETGIPKEVRDEEEPKSGGEEFRNDDETGSYDEWGFYITKPKELRDEEEPKSGDEEFRNNDDETWRIVVWDSREHCDDGPNVAETEGSNISADEGSKISAKECSYIDANGVSDESFAVEVYLQTLREKRIKEMVRRGEMEDRYGMWASSEEETEQQNQREVKSVKTEQRNEAEEAEARTEQQTEREKETAKRKRRKLPEPLKKRRALQGQRNGPKQLDSQNPTVLALCDGEL